ncbi:MAG TPA: SHOCT domain-containing protein [Solirubrobacteraceae bacterium]|jgi:hypothetical protein
MPLLRGIARTAAIAGTATAVSNRVSRRQAGRWAQQEQQQPGQPQAPPTSPPAQSSVDKLRELGDLHKTGVLTDEEFATAKGNVINA